MHFKCIRGSGRHRKPPFDFGVRPNQRSPLMSVKISSIEDAYMAIDTPDVQVEIPQKSDSSKENSLKPKTIRSKCDAYRSDGQQHQPDMTQMSHTTTNEPRKPHATISTLPF